MSQIEEVPFQIDQVMVAGSHNSMVDKVSGGRLGMITTQFGQYVPTLDAEPMQQKAGSEKDYADNTWDIRLKSDEAVRVVEVLDKYRPDNERVFKNPSRTLVYVGLETGKVGAVEIPKYMSHHSTFGFSLRPIEERIKEGIILQPNEVLATAPSRALNGDYQFGREVNTAYFGTFGTNEDGAEAAYEVRDGNMYQMELYQSVEFFVEQNFALSNVHGDEHYYKPLPSIGERVGPSGLIAAKRELKKDFGLLTTKKSELRKIRRPFDQEIYTQPNSEIVDITVIKGGKPSDLRNMPKGMVTYLDALCDNNEYRMKRILELDERQAREARKMGRKNVERDPSWHMMVRDAHKICGSPVPNKGRSAGTMSDVVISGYYVKIVTRKVTSPRLGYKFTGKQGEKYVICNFRPNNQMACDKWGRFAHFHVNPVGVINRNNPSQLFETFNSDACFHTRRQLLEMKERGADFEEMWNFLVNFYRLISPRTFQLVTEVCPPAYYQAHLDAVLSYRIDLEEPPGTNAYGYTAMDNLHGTPYWPPIDVVTIGRHDGTLVTSKNPVRVSNKYIFPLEKIGLDSSACSLPLRQTTGFAAKHNSKQKKTSQMSSQANRVFGESEFRDIFAKAGGEVPRRIMYTHSSAAAAKYMAERMLCKLGFFDSREMNVVEPRGLGLLRHLLQTFGFDLTRDEEPKKDK